LPIKEAAEVLTMLSKGVRYLYGLERQIPPWVAAHSLSHSSHLNGTSSRLAIP